MAMPRQVCSFIDDDQDDVESIDDGMQMAVHILFGCGSILEMTWS
jgi:hypothetical protein